ncbi:MAG: radical SAM family heme chaperone HemW [Bacilli bacterium]|nr:radical SAM family heme chaperone HemW [Bacilli bacterium]
MIKNCYIHIPFCKSICTYCDFCKMYYDKRIVLSYLNALKKEIESIYQGDLLETIYIGGGTPLSLSLEELKILFDILSILKKDKIKEFTIEGNIESITKEKLIFLKENGVNRISIGIESIDSNILKYLGRTLDKNQIREVISMIKEIGFSNINVDLMYAIPGEDISTLKKDIDFLLSLDVCHISTYSLMIEDHTILKINQEENISEDLDEEMYQLICDCLKKNHYQHYEISNFCKEGYSSIHNMCYWNNSNYYGFGLGASSYIDHKRITNTRSIQKYLLNQFVKETEIVSLKDEMEYQVLLNLRKKEGISLLEFRKRFLIDLFHVYNYSSLVDDGFLILEDNHLFIPEEKWYISNEIIVKLLGSEIYE